MDVYQKQTYMEQINLINLYVEEETSDVLALRFFLFRM